MKKKIISLVLTVAMLFSMSTTPSLNAYSANEKEWAYNMNDGGATLESAGYSGSATEITIPSSFAQKPVTKIGGTAFEDNTNYTVAPVFTTSLWATGALAYCGSDAGDTSQVVNLDIANGSIVIRPNSYDFGSSTNITTTCDSYIITQTNPQAPTSNTITVQNGADVNVTIDDVNISTAGCAFSITGASDVELTLKDTNNFASGTNRAGLEVPVGSELTIGGTSNDNLTIIGGTYASGIGGGYNITPANAGTIIIKGGVIHSTGGTASGSTGAGAGIGGGRGGSGGNITIEGGEVTSIGGYRAAGIGGGNGGTSGTILIKDGEINATSGNYSAAIGSGYDRPADSITIEGGTIQATSVSDGAAIGTARIQTSPNSTYTSGGDITISGGTITATSNSNGAGIGGGALIYTSYILPLTITISGGSINASSSNGPGIGSNEGTINISNGTITASSVHNAAGIGGSYRRSGGTINISGGTVVSTSGETGGAAIGGGYSGEFDNLAGSIINISGGDITANAGDYSAGIGGSYGTSAGTINITGGTISASSSLFGAAIGVGVGGNGGTIVISKAIVNVSHSGDEQSADSISAGTGGSIHIGFTGNPDPTSWVCDPLNNRAEVTFTNATLSEIGLVFGTCLITGVGDLDGSYLEGVKTVAPPFSVGDGTDENPYHITSVALLNSVRDYLDKSFILKNDIDINESPFNTGLGWEPIGTNANPFTGNFDGDGYAISNLFIDRNTTNGVGLFGYISQAELKNINVNNANITGNQHVGILAGNAINSVISNSNSSGAVNGPGSLEEAGGLVGYAGGSTISNCSSTASVEGHNGIGGLVGTTSASTSIVHCKSSGSVSANDYVGGLIGLNYGQISGSFSNSVVVGHNYVGGLTGYNYWGGINEILNSFSNGAVTGNQYVGGLVGYNFYATIANSYSTGIVTGTTDIGGLVGINDSGAITSSYFDSDTTNQLDTGKGDPKTTAQLQQLETFIVWDFPTIWTLNNTDNNGYPALAWQGFNHFTPSSDATLSGLTASGVTFAPTFSSETTSYIASVDNAINGTTITAIPNVQASTITINGISGTSEVVPLSVGDNTITVAVTAQNGIATKTYTININRATSGSSGGGSPSGGGVSSGGGSPSGSGGSSDGVGSDTITTESVGNSLTITTITVTTEENGVSTTNSTQISSVTNLAIGTANIDSHIVAALLDKISSVGGNSNNDLIEVSVDTQDNINKLNVSILQQDFENIIDATDSSFAITSPFIAITFDAKALEAISGAQRGGTVVISAGIIDRDSLSEEDKTKVQGKPVYDLTVLNGNTHVSDFNGGYATVTIPYTLEPDENPNAVVIYYLADDGTLNVVSGCYNSDLKAVVFKTTHFSKFVLGYNPVDFNDISADAWYKNAVDFIAARGITSGTAGNSFSPEAKLTRGQFVVLLMNAYQINAKNTDNLQKTNNFTDAGNSYYTNYLLIAKELGIVNGIGNNLFAPNQEITRQEMMVMLYNALKILDEVPATTIDKQLSSFDDVSQVADWAKPAVEALVKADTIGGYNNSIHPTSTTTRAEIAQILYNILSK